MNTVTVKPIPLANLAINIDNPRFQMVGNQREAIQVLIEDQGEKVLNLATDIVASGLNPSELVIVSPHESEKAQFNILEGNRRITALKLLANPDLIPADEKWLLKGIRKLSEDFKKEPITEVSCVIFPKPEEAYRWIKLRHTGENDGVGIVRWDAQQAARFDERVEGISRIALQALDFMKNEASVDNDLKKRLKEVPSSSLERLLEDSTVQDVLGLTINNGRLQTSLQKTEVTKGLSKIVSDLVNKKIKTKDIYTKEDREKYIQTFRLSDLPNKKNKTENGWELTAPPKGTKSPAAKKSQPLSTDRHSIIPRDCVFKIKEKRLNQIYSELRMLNCDKFVNCSAVLFRVFVEMSADTFLDGHKLPKITKDTELKKKIEAIANHFESNQILDRPKLKAIRVAVSNVNDILSMNTFNAYVHNRHVAPISKDLKISWDNAQLFLVKLFEHIK